MKNGPWLFRDEILSSYVGIISYIILRIPDKSSSSWKVRPFFSVAQVASF